LPAAIWGAYTVIVAPDANSTLWIKEEYTKGGYQKGQHTLSGRVWNKLNGEERLLERLDPIFLQMRTNERWANLWPESEYVLKVTTLRDYFARYDYLPMLSNENVLRQTIAFGVQRGLFGYGLGDGEKMEFDTFYFNEQRLADDYPITDSAWLVNAGWSEELTSPTDVGHTSDDEGRAVLPPIPIPDEVPLPRDQLDIPEPKPESPSHSYSGIVIETDLDDMEWLSFYRSVIQPLAEAGADIDIHLSIQASKQDGLDANFIDLRVKESALQIGKNTKVDTSS